MWEEASGQYLDSYADMLVVAPGSGLRIVSSSLRPGADGRTATRSDWTHSVDSLT